MTTLGDVRTPALVLDRERLVSNTLKMSARARSLGVDLRPHLKTAKSIDVARLATAGASGAITVSTLAEAEYFAEQGFDDITYAVGIVPSKLGAVAALARRGATIRVLTDDAGVARAIAEKGAALGVRFHVLLDVDTGLHRSGFDPDSDDLLEAARVLHVASHAELCGVLTHAGNSYGCATTDDVGRVAAEERDGVVAAATRIRDRGIPCGTVSVGSTPTAVHVDHLEGVTEMRPGNYVFYDLFQSCIGSCARDRIAVSVVASVIAQAPRHNRLLIDAGALALSKDTSCAERSSDIGYGLLLDLEGAALSDSIRVRSVNQEHGFVESDEPIPFDRFPIGSRVRVLPNHSCMTAAAFDRYHVIDGATDVVAVWDRVNGW